MILVELMFPFFFLGFQPFINFDTYSNDLWLNVLIIKKNLHLRNSASQGVWTVVVYIMYLDIKVWSNKIT